MKKSFKSLLLVFLLILGGVTLIACNSNKALAKEEDAYMVQAVSAANMSSSGASAHANQNVTLDSSDNPIGTEIKVQIETSLGEGLSEMIDNQLKMVENFLESIEIVHGESDREGYAKMSSYKSKDLEGNEVEYTLYYNITEHEVEDDGEIETEFKGVLVIKKGETTNEYQIDGEVEIEDGEKETKVIHEYAGGKVEISSKTTEGVRKFEYKIDQDNGPDFEFELKINARNNNVKLEVETELGNSKVKMELFVRKVGEDKKHVIIKIELDDFDLIIGKIDSDLESTLTIDTAGEEVVYKFNFKGEIKFKGALTDDEVSSDFNFNSEIRHQKRSGNPTNQ